MNKKLGRLLWPGLWVFFAVMVGFIVAAAATENFILAAIEGGATAILGIYYMICRMYRRKEIQQYVNSAFDSTGLNNGADVPLPMALVRLGDHSIVWANDAFAAITGYQDKYLHQKLENVLPKLSVDWLTAGKTEYPYDITVVF